ncbi:MAG: hypothetical protein WCK73_01885 [Deltaproteobacteria bacterium]
MKTQFTTFTPAAMMALGNEIAASFQNCAASIKSCNEFTEGVRAETAKMLAKLQEERIERAGEEADARRVFASELRSAVRALLDRAELTRETLASDIQAAGDAFQKSRPRRNSPAPAPAPAVAPPRNVKNRSTKHSRKH